jgi:hypothetical protein
MANATLYGLTQSGRRLTLSADITDPSSLESALTQAGVSLVDQRNVLLSSSEFAPLPLEDASTQAQAAARLQQVSVQIPVWTPQTPTDIPPARWPETNVLMAPTVTIGAFVKIGTGFLSVDDAVKMFPNSYFSPAFPTPVQIMYGAYWQRVYTQVLSGQGNYKRMIATTHGVSTTDSQTLGAELGVSGMGLSAKLSATFSTAVTITDQTTTTDEYDISCAANQTVIFTLWQLVEVYTLVDAAGKPISYNGNLMYPSPIGGTFQIPCSFPLNTLTNAAQVMNASSTPFSQ